MRLQELIRFAGIARAFSGLLAAAIDVGRTSVGPLSDEIRQQLRIDSDVSIWQASSMAIYRIMAIPKLSKFEQLSLVTSC